MKMKSINKYVVEMGMTTIINDFFAALSNYVNRSSTDDDQVVEGYLSDLICRYKNLRESFDEYPEVVFKVIYNPDDEYDLPFDMDFLSYYDPFNTGYAKDLADADDCVEAPVLTAAKAVSEILSDRFDDLMVRMNDLLKADKDSREKLLETFDLGVETQDFFNYVAGSQGMFGNGLNATIYTQDGQLKCELKCWR